MFNAVLVSLSDGQSYENVEICESDDLDRLNINRIFEEWTGCIFADGRCIIVHHWKFKVIHIDRVRRGGIGSFKTDRLILDGNIIYSPATIIPHDTYHAMNIPHFFEHPNRGGIAGQLTFSTNEGTFITHDTNVTSIIVDDPRKSGITKSNHTAIASQRLKQQSCYKISKD